MSRLLINGRLPIAVILAMLLAGCAGDSSVLPTQASAPALASTPTPTMTPAATATPTATATATAAPTPAGWRQVPAQASLDSAYLVDVIWTGMRFVAMSDSGNFLDSTDGVLWQVNAHAGSDEWPLALAAGPGGIVAVGSIGSHLASWHSPDGQTWTVRRDSFRTRSGTRSRGDVADVVANGNGWLAVGTHFGSCSGVCGPDRSLVWTSNNGTDWTEIADEEAFHDGLMDAVTSVDDGFVAVGESSEASSAVIWTSADGLQWSTVPHDAVFEGPASPDYNVAGADVAVHHGVIVVLGWAALNDDTEIPMAWWSRSGEPWSRVGIEGVFSGELSEYNLSLAATRDGFIATGWSDGCLGAIWTSTDGVAWRCDASDPRFIGFSPFATAASEAVIVAVGLVNPAPDADPSIEPITTIWYRTLP